MMSYLIIVESLMYHRNLPLFVLHYFRFLKPLPKEMGGYSFITLCEDDYTVSGIWESVPFTECVRDHFAPIILRNRFWFAELTFILIKETFIYVAIVLATYKSVHFLIMLTVRMYTMLSSMTRIGFILVSTSLFSLLLFIVPYSLWS